MEAWGRPIPASTATRAMSPGASRILFLFPPVSQRLFPCTPPPCIRLHPTALHTRTLVRRVVPPSLRSCHSLRIPIPREWTPHTVRTQGRTPHTARTHKGRKPHSVRDPRRECSCRRALDRGALDRVRACLGSRRKHARPSKPPGLRRPREPPRPTSTARPLRLAVLARGCRSPGRSPAPFRGRPPRLSWSPHGPGVPLVCRR